MSSVKSESSKASHHQGTKEATHTTTDGAIRAERNHHSPSELEAGMSGAKAFRAGEENDGEGRPVPPPSSELENEAPDPNIVTWDGPDDPANPRNWTRSKKWRQIVMVSFFTLMSPVVSSMLAPALPEISEELRMPPGVVTKFFALASLSFSIYVLAYAVGPLFLAPLSEILGRQIILQTANMFFLIFNFACSQAPPLAIGGGTIGDLFSPEERGVAMSIYTLAPLAGPALGPITGGFIAESVSWRWVFYSSSIADGIVQLFGFFLLRETYPAKLLADKATRLRNETGNQKLRTEWERPDRTLPSIIAHGLTRPIRIFVVEPVVQVLAAYMAVIYGVIYLVLATFTRLWTDKYGMSVGIGGLNYIALGIGFSLGTQLGSRILDRTYEIQKRRNGGVGTPEMRMPLLMITAIFVPVGLLLYGWTANYRVFWLVPDIGIGIFGIGGIGAFMSIQTYIVDNYHLQAASALAAASAFRSLAGFGFPLFADAMFSKLGIGWGNSVLALVAIIFLPTPYFLWRYGPWLRARGTNAKKQQKSIRM